MERVMFGKLDEKQIDEVLRQETVGRIAYIADGWPTIVPITFVYNGEGYVFCHSAEGHKTTWMRQNPQVGFEVEQIRSMSDWRTVVARGTFELLAPDQDEKIMDFAARLFAAGPPGARVLDRHEDVHRREGIVRPVMFRLHLTEISGRFELA
jgi:nitroimidazol reductase NimA-like FMN-containing flavoprotein (pyridoxamine 5'-phosphate oxidase superfamily)